MRAVSALCKAPAVNGETLTVEPGTGWPESREGIHIPPPDSQWATRNPDAGDVAKFK